MKQVLFSVIYSLDGTESDGLGKYVNDSPDNYSNCQMKKFTLDGQPHLCLVAKTNINAETELRYDYYDTNLFWREKVKCFLEHGL